VTWVPLWRGRGYRPSRHCSTRASGTRPLDLRSVQHGLPARPALRRSRHAARSSALAWSHLAIAASVLVAPRGGLNAPRGPHGDSCWLSAPRWCRAF